MSVNLRDLLKDRTLVDQLMKAPQACRACGVSLQETVTGRRKSPEGEVCSDCYYERLGALIEQNPIVSAGIRRS